MQHIGAADLDAWLREPPPGDGTPLVVVDDVHALGPEVAAHLSGRPEVLVALGSDAGPLDLAVADEGELHSLDEAVAANPLASVALAVLLRGCEQRSVPEGLVAESATYSLLQAGPEALAWLATRGARRARARPSVDPVRIERTDDLLTLTLHRPEVRNAFSAAMREALLDGLAVALADADVQVVLRGEGPAFCSGGDLDEFGTRSDPATAHVVRLGRSVGRVLHEVADRTIAHVHGACVGAGVELPAFAGRVVAAPDSRFRLPELAMGLVPGAGGTASLPRRIGRHRTAWLALTGAWLDVETALAWGLVDEIA